jgi:hypothetical protein
MKVLAGGNRIKFTKHISLYDQETVIFYQGLNVAGAAIFKRVSLNSPVDSLYLNYRVQVNKFKKHIKFNLTNDKPKTQNGNGGWGQ